MNTTLTPIPAKPLTTEFGKFYVDLFPFGGNEVVVVRSEDLSGQAFAICRVQSECTGHFFGDKECDCADQVASALRLIAKKPPGLLVYLRQEGMGGGFGARLARSDDDLRNYAIVPLILQHYGVHEVTLLSLNKRRLDAFRQAGIKIRDRLYTYADGKLVLLSERLDRAAKQVEKGEADPLALAEGSKKRVLVLGDLNVDVDESKGADTKEREIPRGTALNAARALAKRAEFMPLLFGKVGKDRNGELIKKAIVEEEISAFIGVHPTNQTGRVKLLRGVDTYGHYGFEWNKLNNANDYDVDDLGRTLRLAQICEEDYVFIASFLFVQKRFNPEAIHNVMSALRKHHCKLILDITRWSVAPVVAQELGLAPLDEVVLKSFLEGTDLFCVIAEMQILEGLGLTNGPGNPGKGKINSLLGYFNSKWIVCRHREGRETVQSIWLKAGSNPICFEENRPQAYPLEGLIPGLGDSMFASALSVIHTHELRNKKYPKK